MPVYKRLPRSKPKKPDEFISFFDRLYHKAYKNGPKVLAVLAIVALVGLGTLFWREFHSSQAQKMSDQLYRVMNQGTKEEQEKLFKDIKKGNLYAPLGMWASLELAHQAQLEGNCDKVLEELDRYVGHGENYTLRSLIYLDVGACLENKQDLKKAEEVYKQGAGDSKNFLRDWCALRLAAVEEKLGKKEEAKKRLEALLQKDSEASPAVKEQARTYLLMGSS